MEAEVIEADAAPTRAPRKRGEGKQLATVNATSLTPMEMVSQAVASGAGIDIIDKLMTLQERWEKNQARKAFDEAIAQAKAKIPVIIKNKQVGFDSRKAGASRTEYKHETLDEIARVITPILAEYGLSYRFRTTSNINEPISVTCIISHRDGHCEENTLHAGRDDSGNKNSIQAIGSTVTYLQRYTLKAALGIAAANDDDGQKSGDSSGVIDQDQLQKLIDLADEVGADKEKFCKYFGVPALADIPASKYQSAVAALETKRKKVA